MTNHLEIAGVVLAKAALFDHRINPSKDTIAAWAECFTGQTVWLKESLDAVAVHYRQLDPWPLMPGDVIDYCRQQPAWSSREHAEAFIAIWTKHPYATVIEAHTGIRPPEIDVPEGLSFHEEKELRIRALEKWAYEHRDALIAAIMSTRHQSMEIEQ